MAKKTLKKGIFITFEGVEGCGKSTHSWMTYNFLRKVGFDIIYIHEPGWTKIGKKIRKILLNPKNKEMSKEAELFLFEANRAQIVKEAISPALKEKKIIICDRFFDSTTAYQAYAHKLDLKFVERMNEFASGGIKPNLTIILDIQPKTGLSRIARLHIKDRMERKELQFHNRVRSGYKKLAERHKRIKLIKVRDDIEKTQELVRKEILNVIERYKRAG